jgi:hypothetical protein
MANFHEMVPIPARTDMNTGLSAALPSTMKKLLGIPGRLTRDCSEITNEKLKRNMASANVGPFRVTGLTPAVDSLTQVFAEVKTAIPELHAAIKSAGMFCCRAVRGSTSNFSNHSWGTAIDLQIESELDELGSKVVQRGILLLYPFFHKHGWFWGAGYSTRPDPMHFELAAETIRKIAPTLK